MSASNKPSKLSAASTSCELVSEIAGTKTRGSVERKGQSNEYEISYQPTIKGRHQLHIKVEGQHIRGSPFSVSARSPVEKLGTAILTIGGLQDPTGVALNQRGEIVVTEWGGIVLLCLAPMERDLDLLELKALARDSSCVLKEWRWMIKETFLSLITYNNRIQKFTAQGKFLKAVNTQSIRPSPV